MKDELYNEIVDNLSKDLHLVTGNCGVYAIAIRDLFFPFSKFWGVIDNEIMDGYAHIVVERNGRYYDGEGIWTYNSLKARWSKHFDGFEEVSEYGAYNGTDHLVTVDSMKNEICVALTKALTTQKQIIMSKK